MSEETLYRKIDLPSNEDVHFVGVSVWKWYQQDEPTVGFIEVEVEEYLNIQEQIDDMDYKSMFDLWRTAPSGHRMFQGETEDYFNKVMERKRKELRPIARAKE